MIAYQFVCSAYLLEDLSFCFCLLAIRDRDNRKYTLPLYHRLTSWAPLKVLHWPITNTPPKTLPTPSCDYKYAHHCQGEGQLCKMHHQLWHHGDCGKLPWVPLRSTK